MSTTETTEPHGVKKMNSLEEELREELGGMPPRPPAPLWRRILIGTVLPLLLVLAGAAGAYWFVITRPGMPERPPRPTAALVTVTEVQPADVQVEVKAMGTVVPARETTIMPQVNGQVVKIEPEFMAGGRFRQGEPMLRLEKRDYELALEQRRSDVARAEYELRLEQGQQVIAEAELKATGLAVESDANRELLLRKPHLKRFQAALAAARASLEAAELDLKRTTVCAPFNAVVTEQLVDVGTQASTQTRLVTLVGTDAYWIQVSLPVEKLAWIQVPGGRGEKGATARVLQAGQDPEDARTGNVLRTLAALETEGRMANLLVEVQDPLDLRKRSAGSSRPPLLLGAYVQVSIDGRTLRNVVSVPRRAVREGDQLWVMSPENTLEIRRVKIAWRDRDRALVADGLDAGERVVTSAIPTPVHGMQLRVAGTRSSGDGPPARAPDRASASPAPAPESTPAGDDTPDQPAHGEK